MKIDRLLAVTIYLLNHEKTSASALAQHFEVSVRTIQRDIESLCLAGIPVAAEYGASGGYEILDTFHLNRQAAGETDYQYIVTALQALVSASGDREAADVLEKMQAAANGKCDSAAGMEIQLDLSAALENPGLSGKISLIRDAVRNGKQLEFMYTNSMNETKLHVVEPVFAVFKWFAWYLIAWYEPKQAYCMFKLLRMQDPRMLDAPVKRKHNAEKVRHDIDTQHDPRPCVTITLKGEKSIKAKCVEYLHGTISKESEDGTFILTASFPRDDHYWYGTLLGFGTKVRVLEPPELISRIKNSCREILDMYAQL
jgi:predicted DNA-binding transcriptional regulator YafY